MKKSFLLLPLGLACAMLTGCVTPFRAPADVANIKLDRVHSPVVEVEKIWLERKNGPLLLRGFVLKRLSANDTSQTHLHVTLYDAAGRELRTSVEGFTPQQIPRPRTHRHRHGDATYQVVLDPLPAGTARIEVRAHEGADTARGE